LGLIIGGYIIRIIPSAFEQIVALIYFLILTVAIAYIFIFSKNKKMDTAIGELSYPIYLSHQLVFKLMSIVLLGLNHELITILSLFTTLVLSFVLVKVIENPIDKFRHSLLK
jgi:peptidoglycan/LPS O-acetylase OafA/YrhL